MIDLDPARVNTIFFLSVIRFSAGSDVTQATRGNGLDQWHRLQPVGMGSREILGTE